MKQFKFSNYIKYSTMALVAAILVACGGGNCAPDQGSAGGLITFSSPAEYPAGIATTIPIVVSNVGIKSNNITYSIIDNNSGASISITPQSAANCATLYSGQSCALQVQVPAGSNSGAFTIRATALAGIKTQSTVGLTEVPANNESGINGVISYYDNSVALPSNGSGNAIVTFVVNSATAGAFNTIDLVDSSGNSIAYQVLTGNSGNGLTALSQGTVVSLAVNIPRGATQLSFFPTLKMNGAVIANGSSTTPTTINVLRPSAPVQGTLSIVPSNFALDENITSQTVTVYNDGNGPANGIAPIVNAPMTIDQSKSTCGTKLESGATCTYVINFAANTSDKAGTSSFTVNYNTGTTTASDTSTFTYKGKLAVADLNISDGTNSNFNFKSTTANPSVSSLTTITNSGTLPINNITFNQLQFFTTDITGVTNPCTPGIVLQPRDTCNVNMVYTNPSVTALTTANVTVAYKYNDPIDPDVTLNGSSLIGVTYQTVQSQAILSANSSNISFGNILNNNVSESQMVITIINTGDNATGSAPTFSFESAAGIYSITSNTCTAPLAAGANCTVTLQSGPAPATAGTVANRLIVTYPPYTGATNNNSFVNLATQVVTAQTAVITTTQTNDTGFAGGNGTTTTPFMLQESTPGTVTFTATNSGTVPANGFKLMCGGSSNFMVNDDDAIDTIVYADSAEKQVNAATTGSSAHACTSTDFPSTWTMQSNNCAGTTLAANSGTCNVVFALNSPTTGAQNLTVNDITMNWTDQDSPNGQDQQFEVAPTFANVYAAPSISFSPTPINVAPGCSTTLTATLAGGYNVADQVITLSDDTAQSLTITNNPCTLNQANSSCIFNLSAPQAAVIGAYTNQIGINNSGNATTPSTLSLNIVTGWTWVSGANTINQLGVYGTQGIPDSANIPGARNGSVGWTGSDGTLWLFGGKGYTDSGTGYLNDLWKYNPTTNQWTWISGSNTTNQLGVYGTQGTAAATNAPGARQGSISWIDSSGKLWLFGGLGYATSGVSGYLNDLWQYDPATQLWTWVSGTDTINQVGVYGTKGTAAATNVPGARQYSVSWIDSIGRLWLFGGVKIGNTYLNDLWKYDPTTNEWTWISGSNTINQLGVYGTKGTPDPTNVPGARNRSISWNDSSGNMWLFGGYGYAVSGSYNFLNDLWKYDPTTNTWTWISGSDTINQLGEYGTKGTPNPANVPGAREDSINWIDSSGNMWLFGGSGYATSGGIGLLNDMWQYNPTTNQWTWISGTKTTNQSGVYSTQGTTTATNVPGARKDSISWIDSNNNLWLFGGNGYAASGVSGYLNDMWMLTTK